MNRTMSACVLLLVISGWFASAIAQSNGAANIQWKTLSKNTVVALKSGNIGLQQVAMRRVVQYGKLLQVDEAIDDVMKIFISSREIKTRRLAFMTLTRMNTPWSQEFLTQQMLAENDPVILRQLLSVFHKVRQTQAGTQAAAEIAPETIWRLNRKYAAIAGGPVIH